MSSDLRCIFCLHPSDECICTESEYRAWAADRDAQEAAERAAYEAKYRKPVKVVEDSFVSLGHKSYSPHLLAWEMESQHDDAH